MLAFEREFSHDAGGQDEKVELTSKSIRTTTEATVTTRQRQSQISSAYDATVVAKRTIEKQNPPSLEEYSSSVVVRHELQAITGCTDALVTRILVSTDIRISSGTEAFNTHPKLTWGPCILETTKDDVIASISTARSNLL